jgi:hypothetical protein
MSMVIKNPDVSNDFLINDVGDNIVKNSSFTVPASRYHQYAASSDLVTALSDGDLVCNDGTTDITNLSDAVDLVKGFQQKLAIENGRTAVVDNRLPSGYTVYITGIGDDISTPGYGGGNKLKFDSTTYSIDFQLLNHYYIICALAMWFGCTEDNYFDGTLYAPASTGWTNSTGDYDKVEVIPSSGLYLLKPVTAGTGAWDVDLTAVQTGTTILKSVPVPSAGNTGWFDYDADTNTLTDNTGKTGGYNLYDFNANLHAFGRYIWGTKIDGSESALDITGLVAKKIFNTWKVKIDFKKDGGSLASEKARVKFIVGAKGNI